MANKPNGFGAFDSLMRKLVKVKQSELPDDWDALCHDCNTKFNSEQCGNECPGCGATGNMLFERLPEEPNK